ncbi:D-hexose-6-phosphate mutarotase [Rodentibacter trehalosifermentans]|uniref:Putative glucose-6-phosphate 1-epimerase n=1 Tax=Rodentibacter trehalosifermentans TaxID=1908263 RepID=A0A1V3IVT4_9PAST|nr:D-hexose-6-phosphate mutarotase [Rodentibacter trehalosifermentans]OOF46031.1 D-hexose-6-phosphate mutarotase [Rodentibacter trehalosifermentans]OOF47670.1 D-hexose-6-phosphate mutarotase [Rodentibacter trehalosifermentans]OOF53100.1 D-hexose-6-phosphate mutarotase [Rodentibacter trehalosifermentans]
MKIQLLKTLTPELNLVQQNDIPVLHLKHAVGIAQISLQGAQLLSWQPSGAKQDMLWLSEIEPFQMGTAIRGGVPICYPWFGSVKQPAHGTARIRLWQLSHYDVAKDKVRLVFSLFSDLHIIEAKVEMIFTDKCRITFTHYGKQPAQVALHSYFNVGDIHQISIENLPTTCFNSLTQQMETVPSPRMITENVDCIYSAEKTQNQIVDKRLNRTIRLHHHNAGELVLWNPWHKPTSAMSEQAYQHMVCLETARIEHLLAFGESVAVEIEVKG